MSKTIKEIIESMTEEQQSVAYTLLGETLGNPEVQHSAIPDTIMSDIFKNAKSAGSLKDSVLEHAATYGIETIEELVPQHKSTSATPIAVRNNTEWVATIMNGIHKQPFARVKTIIAKLSEASIRAKGYVKGGRKVESVFEVLKRTTEPTTVYFKQKIDRDDVIDIVDFSVVEWIKAEMQGNLEEEIARAILLGDGRDAADPHKIDTDCIRPIVSDDDLYTIKHAIEDNSNPYKSFIRACVKSRKEYKGSGKPTLFTTEDLVSEILLLEDATGNRIYKTVEEIKAVLRVDSIVTVSDLEGFIRPTNDSKEHQVMGIIVNIKDYSRGANETNYTLFDKFDIDYNQHKYLIETRCSGALARPLSAIVIEKVVTPAPLAAAVNEDEPSQNE